MYAFPPRPLSQKLSCYMDDKRDNVSIGMPSDQIHFRCKTSAQSHPGHAIKLARASLVSYGKSTPQMRMLSPKTPLEVRAPPTLECTRLMRCSRTIHFFEPKKWCFLFFSESLSFSFLPDLLLAGWAAITGAGGKVRLLTAPFKETFAFA